MSQNEEDKVEVQDTSPFMQKYVLWEQILNEMSHEISERMGQLIQDPEVENGRESFKEGTATLTIEASLYAHNMIKSSRELRQSLIGAHQALKQLEEMDG